MFCREHVAQVRDIIPELRARGAELVIVGNGQPWQAAAFRDELAVEGALYVDPALTAYRAAGLRRSAGGVFRPSVVTSAVRALRGGHRQKGIQGDPWQLGGVLVVAPDGAVRYRHVSRAAGDHAANEAILAALSEGHAPATPGA